jgi:anti-sigma factor RsiW
MTMHEEWTDRLSDYLDNELEDGERAAVDAHLRACADCTAVLEDLRRVVARARAVTVAARPPQADLWTGVARRVAKGTGLSLTMTQLAAAAVLIAAVSGGLVWQFAPERETREGGRPADPNVNSAARADAAGLVAVSLADDQYDAALLTQTIDQAIAQAREALAADPANSYLSGHLVDARRRKLDLLRRATALTDMD